MGWFVYALYNSVAQKIYVGQTDNLERRLKEHNAKLGKHFTARSKGNWELVYQEECSSRAVALKREKQLKTFRGREFVKKFVRIEDSAPL